MASAGDSLRDTLHQAAGPLRKVSEEQSARRPELPPDHPATLEWPMQDYVDHLQHHLGQILGVKGDRETKS
jgi:hypothetical protein